MGQKVHPTGFRIAVTEQGRSRWSSSKRDCAKHLIEDQKSRRFIM
jgi:small subunit ribosomal protein S3